MKRLLPALFDPTRPQRRDVLAGGLVLLATVIAYLPALSGGFIWNDVDYVTSPALRSWTGLERIWTEFGATEQYYPALHTAFWIQHRLWGDAPLGYHWVNVLAHAGCAVLFGVVLRRLAAPGAWIAAALFALHPVHAESVAWISEQKNTLSLFCYLAAGLVYLRFDADRRGGAYALASAWFVLALLFKTATATLPAALLVVLWWKRGRLEWRRDVLPLAPWLAAGAAAGVLISWIERHYGGAVGTEFTLSFPERLILAGRSFWFYVRSLLWPLDLNFIYPRWTIDPASVLQWLYPLAAVALLGAAWIARRRRRGPLAALLFFAGSLFPVLGFVNLYGARYSWVWDHWQYLPDLGPLALVAASMAVGVKRIESRWRVPSRIALALLLAACATLTWQHSRIFRDDETLYTATLRRNPAAWMAHGNLGSLLAVVPDRRDEAIGHLFAALRLKPDAAELHENLANLLAQRADDHAAAREHYETALQLEPGRTTTLNNLGLLLFRSGSIEAAENAFRQALAQSPQLASAGANLGTLLRASGRAADAVPVLQQALAADPTLVAAHLELGNALKALDRPVEAQRAYRDALRFDPEAADVRIQLADLLLDQGDATAAVSLLEAALVRDPASAEAQYHLGEALLRLGRTAEGVGALRAATGLQPGWAAAHVALGTALARSRDFTAAIEEFRIAARLRPEDWVAHTNLANALLVTGRTAEAIREYEAAQQLQPENPAIRANLDLAREQLRQSGR